MNIFKRFYRFIRYNNCKRISLAAYVYSAYYRMCILFIKSSKLQKRWGEEGRESDPKDTVEHYYYCRRVSRVVNNICDKTSWESKCLVRALTAQKLLKRKKIHSTLYLGCGLLDGKMVAHAWIRCGEYYVTGGDGSAYSTVDYFYT